jgi:hypothetical protein
MTHELKQKSYGGNAMPLMQLNTADLPPVHDGE